MLHVLYVYQSTTKERERDTKGPSITSFRTNTFALKNYLFISSRGEREREREREKVRHE